MVSCKHCSTQNSLDSTFCKRCGTSLSEEALQEAQAKLDALIEEGNALFNQGRTEEAMAVADACVTSNPSSVAALSLKVLCHERKHEIAEALECAERIVELNPDSELDKIKRNALRSRLQVDLRVPETPNRGLAFIGATAAVVLVGCLGVAIARITSKPAPDAVVAQRNAGEAQLLANQMASVTPNVANPNPAAANTAPTTGTPNTSSNTAAQVPDGLNRNPGPGDVPAIGARPQNRVNDPGVRLPSLPSGQALPDPRDASGEVAPLPVNPGDIQVEPEGSGRSTVAVPTQGSGPKPDDPTPIHNRDSGSETSTQPTATEDPNQGIQIEVKSPGSRTSRGSGGGTAVLSGNGLETLQRVGSQQFQLGNYAAAARSYEQAVRAGGDAIILNQRLGQAYERMGRASDAADAYRRCIAACEAAIASGSGNRARHESVKATAEQALKVLQGG